MSQRGGGGGVGLKSAEKVPRIIWMAPNQLNLPLHNLLLNRPNLIIK